MKPLGARARNLLLVVVCLLGLAAAPLFHAFADPTGAFTEPRDVAGFAMNSRLVKTRRVLDADPFDTLILGSSRAALMDPTSAPSLGRAYNLAFLSGRPSDYPTLLALLEREGKLPRTILFGLDLSSFQAGTDVSPLEHHPVVTNEGPASWLLRNLFSFPGFGFFGVLAHYVNETGEPMARWSLDTGHYRYVRFDSAIAADPDAFFASVILPPEPSIPVALDHAEVDDLRRLLAIADRNGVAFCTFWHPHRPEDVGRYSPEAVASLRNAVADVVPPALDSFSVGWAADHRSWYDLRHPVLPRTQEVLLDAAAACERSGSASGIAAAR